jgi:ABC-type microcin C transport system permease subunit YejB
MRSRASFVIGRALTRLAGALTVTFIVMQFAPGGPVDRLLTQLYLESIPSQGPLR